jgi:hypothetical protein
VERFENWPCAYRWVEYAPEQRVLLFLRGEGAPSYEILSGGGEGEMPVVAGEVLSGPAQIRGYTSGTFEAFGGQLTATRVPLSEMLACASRYRDLFRFTTQDNRGWSITPTASPQVIDAFAASSPLAGHLVRETVLDLGYELPDPPPAPAKHPGTLPSITLPSDGVDRPAWGPIAVLGDLDGDGNEDWVIGAPEHDSHRGAVWICFRSKDGTFRSSKRIEFDVSQSTACGESVAPLGDFDGDGIPDVAVGAPHRDAGNAVGSIFLLFLRRDGTLSERKEIRASGGGLKAEMGERAAFATAIAHLGDIDGDGIGDLAASEPGVFPDFDPFASEVDPLHPGAGGKAGAVWILFLDRTGGVRAESRIWDPTGAMYSQFGQALASIGDLDGDGIGELAVGSPFDDGEGQFRGAVWLFFLDRAGSLRRAQKPGSQEAGFSGLLRDHDGFGRALAAIGDVNGDSIPDLAVGAAGDDDAFSNGRSDTGAVWVLCLSREGSVVRESKISQVAGNFPEDLPERAEFGRQIFAAGYDTDGRPRLGVRAPLWRREPLPDPKLWVFSLAPDGTVRMPR